MKYNQKYLLEYTRHLVKNSLDCISTSDNDGHIVVFNPAAEKTFGYTREEIIKLGPTVMFKDESEFNRISEILERDGQYIGEVENKRKNGEIFTSFLTANIIFDDSGEAIGTMGVSRDISETSKQQKELEEQYKKNQELLNKIESLSEIATSVTNGIVETDTNGVITWCNYSFERITGYQMEELVGHIPSEILRIPHFYVEKFNELTAKGPIIDAPMQVAHYKKNGELFWILVETTAIRDKEGNIKKYIEVCTEITEQKQTEIALIDSEQNFRTISETIEDVFYLYNISEKQYEYISPNCVEVLGADQDFFYSGKKHTSTYVYPEDQPIVYEADKKVRNGMPYDIEFRMVVNGKLKWIRERSNPIYDEYGEIVKNSGICTDITESKRNLELIEEQNNSINESMMYAKRIQEATLPREEEIKKYFPNSFAIYQPKDYIGGDLYIIDQVRDNSGDEYKVFIVADCTGHGVPGGILSILCNSLLKQSLTEYSVNTPAEALNWVRKQLERLFQIENNRNIQDGMDVGFCVLNPKTNKMRFAGANNTCLIIRDGDLIEIKGDRQHVGYAEIEQPFNDHEFQLQPGDHVYLSSDGIMDQFGGNSNKKFLRKHFVQLLIEISSKTMDEQHAIIMETFQDWKGKNEQTDDICVLGIKI